jgi:hypothetical protein
MSKNREQRRTHIYLVGIEARKLRHPGLDASNQNSNYALFHRAGPDINHKIRIACFNDGANR